MYSVELCPFRLSTMTTYYYGNITSCLLILSAFSLLVSRADELCDCFCNVTSGGTETTRISLGVLNVPGQCDTGFGMIEIDQDCQAQTKDIVHCDVEDVYPVLGRGKDVCLCNGPYGSSAACDCGGPGPGPGPGPGDPDSRHNMNELSCSTIGSKCVCTSTDNTGGNEVITVSGTCDAIFEMSSLTMCSPNIECDRNNVFEVEGRKDTCVCNAPSVTQATLCECKRSVERQEIKADCRCQDVVSTTVLAPESTRYADDSVTTPNGPATRSTRDRSRDRSVPSFETTPSYDETTYCDNCTTVYPEDGNSNMDIIVIGVTFPIGVLSGMAIVIAVLLLCRRHMKNKKKNRDIGKVENTSTNDYKTKITSTTSFTTPSAPPQTQPYITLNHHTYSEVDDPDYLCPRPPLTMSLTAGSPTLAPDGGPPGVYSYIDVDLRPSDKKKPKPIRKEPDLKRPQDTKPSKATAKAAAGSGLAGDYNHVNRDGSSQNNQGGKPNSYGILAKTTNDYDAIERQNSPQSPVFKGTELSTYSPLCNATSTGQYDMVERDINARKESASTDFSRQEEADYNRIGNHSSVQSPNSPYDKVIHETPGKPGNRKTSGTVADDSYGMLDHPTSANSNSANAYDKINRENAAKISGKQYVVDESYSSVNVVT